MDLEQFEQLSSRLDKQSISLPPDPTSIVKKLSEKANEETNIWQQLQNCNPSETN